MPLLTQGQKNPHNRVTTKRRNGKEEVSLFGEYVKQALPARIQWTASPLAEDGQCLYCVKGLPKGAGDRSRLFEMEIIVQGAKKMTPSPGRNTGVLQKMQWLCRTDGLSMEAGYAAADAGTEKVSLFGE